MAKKDDSLGTSIRKTYPAELTKRFPLSEIGASPLEDEAGTLENERKRTEVQDFQQNVELR